jgi:hypothetical protein
MPHLHAVFESVCVPSALTEQDMRNSPRGEECVPGKFDSCRIEGAVRTDVGDAVFDQAARDGL